MMMMMMMMTLLVGRQEGHPACKNRVVGCWCACLSGAKYRQLYDQHINSMTYTLFFPDYQFHKVLLMFPRVIIFLLFYVEAP